MCVYAHLKHNKAQLSEASRYQSRFNSVLLNYFRDHRDSMGFHMRGEVELVAMGSLPSDDDVMEDLRKYT